MRRPFLYFHKWYGVDFVGKHWNTRMRNITLNISYAFWFVKHSWNAFPCRAKAKTVIKSIGESILLSHRNIESCYKHMNWKKKRRNLLFYKLKITQIKILFIWLSCKLIALLIKPQLYTALQIPDLQMFRVELSSHPWIGKHNSSGAASLEFMGSPDLHPPSSKHNPEPEQYCPGHHQEKEKLVAGCSSKIISTPQPI